MHVMAERGMNTAERRLVKTVTKRGRRLAAGIIAPKGLIRSRMVWATARVGGCALGGRTHHVWIECTPHDPAAVAFPPVKLRGKSAELVRRVAE